MSVRSDVLSRLLEWWNAERKDQGMDHYFYEYYEHYDVARLEAEAKDYAALVLPRGRVLSIGCGYGLVDMLMASMGRGITALVGLDVNRIKLAGMDRIAESLGMVNVSPVTGSGFTLPFRTASFDTILILATLSHVDAETPLLQDAARILKPGGRLAIVEDANAANPRRYLWCLRMRRDGAWVERPVNPFRVVSILRRLGFKRIALQPYTYQHDLNPRQNIWYSVAERIGPLGSLFAIGFIVIAEDRRA